MGQRGGSQRVVYSPEVRAAAEARQHEFTGHHLPIVLRIAHRRFRNIPHRYREDCIQEAVAIAWRLFLDYLRKGQDPTKSRLGVWAVKAVFANRTLLGEMNRGDVLSKHAQDIRGFRVVPMPQRGPHSNRVVAIFC
jgi:hypothetical protein